MAAALTAFVTAGRAQTSVVVPDFSFEAPDASAAAGQFQDNTGLSAGAAVPDTGNAWYYLGGFIQSGSPVGVQVATANGMSSPPDGAQSGYLNNGSWLCSSNLTVIEPNTTYTLTLAESGRTGFPETAGFRFGLVYGTAPGADLTNHSLALRYVSLSTVTNNAAPGSWFAYSTSFTTGTSDPAIGQSLFVLLGSESNPDSFAQQVNFDDIQLTVSSATNPPSGSLPSGWHDQDIGSPSLAGAASYTNGFWSVSGGGADILGATDQFNFVSTSLSGDGMIIARVIGQTGSDPWAQAGVMVRNDTSPGSAAAAVVVTPGNGVAFRYRSSAGGSTSQTELPGIAAPAWVRLSRSGGALTAAYSIDGLHWTQIGLPQNTSLGDTVLAGLAVTAHDDLSLNRATLTSVLVVPGPQVGVPADLINPYTGGIPFAGETTWPLPRLDVATNALTPRMGWNSWFTIGDNPGPSEALIKSVADAMASNGLASAGYRYVVIDCSWLASGRGSRNADGNIIVDPTRWPSGMKALADYVHSKGLLMGGYTDIGASGYGSPAQIGSFAHYQQDADQFAAWGWDFIKIDDHGPGDFYAAAHAVAHNASGRPIVLSLSTPQVDGLKFAPRIANSFRVNNDISFTFGSVSWSGILTEFDTAENDWYAQAPGHWNDPDMLCTGMNGISDTEGRSHFNMWAILGAPLMLGTDPRPSGAVPSSLAPPLSAATLATLTNLEVIAVDQDPLGAVGVQVAPNVYAKPLGSFTSGQYAVLLLNRSSQAASIAVAWSDLGLIPGSAATVRDLWAHQDLGTYADGYTSPDIPSHGSMMLKVSGSFDWNRPRTYEAESGYNTLSGTAYYVPHNASFSAGAYVTGVGGGTENALQFNQVSAPAAGLYQADIYYAAGVTRTADLSVNGGPAATLTFPPTGGDTQVGVIATYLQLNAGENTVLLDNPGGVAPNFDKLVISLGVPTGLTAVAGDSQVKLTWTAAGAESCNVYRGTTRGGEGNAPIATGITNGTYIDTGLTNGQTYYYIVTAINPELGGESPPSAEVSARPRFATSSSAYRDAILAADPVAYWRLNENVGPTAHDSAGGFDGSYGGAVTLGIAGPRPADFLGFETTNTAALFSNNLNGCWVTVPALNLNTNRVTITCWIHPTGDQAEYAGLVFCRSGSTTSGLNYAGGGNAGMLGYTWNDSQSTWGWNSGLMPPLNKWTFVALAVEPSRATLYLFDSGRLQTATNILYHPVEPFAGPATIGTDTYSSQARVFNGAIDEVAVFNRTLTLTEVRELYANGFRLPMVQLTAGHSGSNLDLVWPQGTLFQAHRVTGPWVPVAGALSPFTLAATNTSMFYRVLLQQ